MGFTEKTLPEERANNFGDTLFALHGVTKWEWWPTIEELSLINSLWESEEHHAQRIVQFGESTANYLYETLEIIEFYRWLCSHFVREEWTSDYTVPVSDSMVLRALNVFDGEAVAKI